MTHDQKLLNEYKIKLEADLMELQFMKYSNFDVLVFLDEIRHLVLSHKIDFEFELDCEPKNNPAKY